MEIKDKLNDLNGRISRSRCVEIEDNLKDLNEQISRAKCVEFLIKNIQKIIKGILFCDAHSNDNMICSSLLIQTTFTKLEN